MRIFLQLIWVIHMYPSTCSDLPLGPGLGQRCEKVGEGGGGVGGDGKTWLLFSSFRKGSSWHELLG